MTDDKMLARIAALLRQAEGTDNAHEAEAFMAAAQRLATATSIDLAVARSHSDVERRCAPRSQGSAPSLLSWRKVAEVAATSGRADQLQAELSGPPRLASATALDATPGGGTAGHKVSATAL